MNGHVYYTGNLPVDRIDNLELSRIADKMSRKAAKGDVFLLQRKIKPDFYEYLAIPQT